MDWMETNGIEQMIAGTRKKGVTSKGELPEGRTVHAKGVDDMFDELQGNFCAIQWKQEMDQIKRVRGEDVDWKYLVVGSETCFGGMRTQNTILRGP